MRLPARPRSRTRPRLNPMSFPSSPIYEGLFHRVAETQLRVIVVGGSLSGLTAAYNLKQAGHDVRVLERSDGKLKFSAGVRVPPNMAKLLYHWGIGAQLREKSLTCPRIDFLDDSNGERLSAIVYHKELMKELQADVFNLTYADLFEMIRDLTVRSGVKIDYNSTVVDINVDAPYVVLKGGGKIDADLIVGADGSHSLVRQKLVGEKENFDTLSPSAHYYLIPTSKMEQDPLLAPLLEDGTWSLWTGDLRCILGYPANMDYYAMCVIIPRVNTRLSWTETIPVSALDCPGAEERIQRLLALGDKAIETQYVNQGSLENWYSQNGKLVLVGNSVHMTNPGSMNEAALSVEDGAVLGSLLSRLQTGKQSELVRLLAAYQEVRQDRCEAIIATDVELLTFSTLPPGPAREERNAGFKAIAQSKALDWEDVDDDILSSAWEEFRNSFGYEAYDAADDWWVDWGIMVHRIGATTGDEAQENGGSSTAGFGASILTGLETQTVVTTVET